jgi:methylglutaconyl-CoA hydratase
MTDNIESPEIDGVEPAVDEVLLEVTQEGVAVVRLNRPQVHNAFNGEMIQKLSEIFDDLDDQDGIRVVIIDGSGTSFSNGGDLTALKHTASLSEKELRDESDDFAGMLLRLRALHMPTLALVHGGALGGGLGIVAACDIAVATADAQFAMGEVRHGQIPAIIAPYVIDAIGARAARRYMLTGEAFGADEALRLGLVSSVVADHAALAGESERIVTALLKGAPGALTAAKELLDLVTYLPIDEDLVEETSVMTTERQVTEEAREGLEALLEKRAPGWTA